MKVLLINQSDISGGAGIAGYRLYRALSAQNISTNLLVDNTKIGQAKIHLVDRRRLVEDLFERLSYRLGLNYLSITSSFAISQSEIFQAANIINFHNLHGGYFNYLAIPKLTTRKPTILTLHDMWSFTGHCAYSFECDRWKIGCGQCPHLDTYPSVPRDSTALEWKLKRWVYNHSNLTIVTPSAWLAKLAQQSLLGQFAIHHIPNGLDLSVYKPLDSQISKAALGLPDDKKVLFFMAQSLKDPRKGSDLLILALKQLPKTLSSELVLMTMGEGGEALADAVDIPIVSLGYVGGDRLKAIAYSAADLFVFPTRADNLPLVVQESVACGTPVVSFDIGGVPDIVRPGITGLLAQPENATELANKIVELLEDTSLRCQMAQRCREIAVAEYSVELQVERYIALYNQVIKNFQYR